MTFWWITTTIVMQLFGSVQSVLAYSCWWIDFFPLWLFKLFKLLNDPINPGITTGKVNYGSRLETLQRNPTVSGSHAVSMNAHVASVYPHTQFTQTFIKSLRIHIYSNTHAITQYTCGYPPESKDTQRTVDTVFCRLLAGVLWGPYFMVIHLFLPEKTQSRAVIIVKAVLVSPF